MLGVWCKFWVVAYMLERIVGMIVDGIRNTVIDEHDDPLYGFEQHSLLLVKSETLRETIPK